MKTEELAKQAGLVIVDYRQESLVRVYDIWTDKQEILIDGCSKKQARAFLRGYIAAQEKQAKSEPEAEKVDMLDKELYALAKEWNVILIVIDKEDKEYSVSGGGQLYTWSVLHLNYDQAKYFLDGYSQGKKDAYNA